MNYHNHIDGRFSGIRYTQFQRSHCPAHADDVLEMSTVWPGAEADTVRSATDLPIVETEPEIKADATFPRIEGLHRQK